MNVDLSLDKNEESLHAMLSHSSDFKSSEFTAGEHRYRLFYLDTMIELAVVQEHIIRPLLQRPEVSVREAVSILDYSETGLLAEAAKALIEGKTVLQIEGQARLYLLDAALHKERSINVPVNEKVLRGSHHALIEDINTNLNLLRKLIATPDLVVKFYQLGRRSNTRMAVLYLRSLANEEVVKELDRRVGNIDIDYVESPGFVEEMMQDSKFSLFPQILVTERPDRVRSYLMDGKIAVLTDGSPDCLITPVSFWAFFQSPDDYQIDWMFGSALRILRIVCFIIAFSLPGAYVALVTFDPRIIPFEIALTLQSSMQYIAMPPVMEAIFMLATLEILREATIRLSNPVGQTIGVVGGIVIGTVVVQSNLVSNMMVVVVAFTAVASFVIPVYEMRSTVRLLAYPNIILCAIFGFIGLELSFLLILTHLARLNTMGIPYFYSGLLGGSIKDTLFRGPLGSLKERPKESLAKDEMRIESPRGWNE
jgi:spore germination protein KA